MTQQLSRVATTISPWLSVRQSADAVEFYKSAFGAVEVYRLDGGEQGVISRLSVDGAEFWVAEELNGSSVRMILTVADPDAVFAKARAAGASQVYPVK